VTGDGNDILSRVKLLIPLRWFSWVAPYREAIIGSVSDQAWVCYTWTTYVRAHSRLATAVGIGLDVLCYDFLGRNLSRGSASDDVFRAPIQAINLKERVTRSGMSAAVAAPTGKCAVDLRASERRRHRRL
jgi:hypothetical protein